jgi:hypothetical protein
MMPFSFAGDMRSSLNFGAAPYLPLVTSDVVVDLSYWQAPLDFSAAAARIRGHQNGDNQAPSAKPQERRRGRGGQDQCQPDKPHERPSVLQLLFGLIVGQRVQSLQHQNLEHQYCVVRRSAALRPIRAG